MFKDKIITLYFKDTSSFNYKSFKFKEFFNKGFEKKYSLQLYNKKQSKLFGNANISSKNVFHQKYSGNQRLAYKVYGSLNNTFYFSVENHEEFLNGDKSYRFNNLSYFNDEGVLRRVSSSDQTLGYFVYRFKYNYIFLGKIPWSIGLENLENSY